MDCLRLDGFVVVNWQKQLKFTLLYNVFCFSLMRPQILCATICMFVCLKKHKMLLGLDSKTIFFLLLLYAMCNVYIMLSHIRKRGKSGGSGRGRWKKKYTHWMVVLAHLPNSDVYCIPSPSICAFVCICINGLCNTECG